MNFTKLLIAFLFIGLSISDENIRRKRVLILYDNAALLTTHSMFLQNFKSKFIFSNI